MAGSRLKSILSAVSYNTGLLCLLQQVRLRRGAVIFMYHRVLSPDAIISFPVQPGMYVSLPNFTRHIKWMQSHLSILSLQELILRLRSDKDISGCCALTFDDGWVDNYQHVFPVIQKYQVPITVFLATGFIGTGKWFWSDEVASCLSLIYKEKVDIGIFSGTLKKLFFQSGVCEKKELEAVIDNCVERLKRYPSRQRQNLLQELNLVCRKDEIQYPRCLMNWSEIREMAASGLVEFGSHTVNHMLLDQISPKQALIEIVDSKNQIEHEIGQQCLLFAYPNGNYSNEIISVLKEAGVVAAVTTKRGYVNRTLSSSMLELPRVALHDDVSCSRSLFLWRVLVQ